MIEGVRTAAGRLGVFADLEQAAACALARSVSDRRVLFTLRAASRYGDWGLSATVAALLAADRDLLALAAWIVATATGLVIQRELKWRWARNRPCARPGGPPQRVSIPDPGSFPSGHTLHATLAAVVIWWTLPTLGPVFALIAVVTGASRVVLGVHYPSDVAAGAALGMFLGACVNFIVPG